MAKVSLKKNKKTKNTNKTVVYFYVDSKRRISCRNCKLGVFLDEPTVNSKGVETDLSDKAFSTGSMTEFERHVKAHKSIKDKVYSSNVKEVKSFFKKLA